VLRDRQLQFFALVTTTACLVIRLPNEVNAASVNGARITRVNNQVQLLHPAATARPASVNDIVDEGTLVRTGSSSHAELTFPDETVVRLAANTTFGFKKGIHDLSLTEGAVLVEAPKNTNGATIHTASVAAAITGTTAMIEYHPGVYKFLVLKGTGRVYRPGHFGDSVLVAPGQLVIGNPSVAVSDPVDFDIARFVKTSRFITDFPPLRSEKMVLAECQKQQREKSKKFLVETNMVIFGGGNHVSLVGQAPALANTTTHPGPSTARTSPQ
jgi:FecR-like protein